MREGVTRLGLGSISLPWLGLGDFNCVLRLEEKKGGIPTKEIYISEFQNWISDNGLVEDDSIVELKLESESDLLDYDPADEVQFTKVADAKAAVEEDDIKDFIFNHYKDKFNGGEVDIDPKLFDVNHESISASESTLMNVVPTLEEIKEDFFDLGEDSAPGPDGIPNGINSNFIVLIPKNGKSDAIKDFRPIGLSNFFFKIITKIMDTRLGMVLNKLISEEQVAFMKGRNIHENVALASELINEINANRKFGNVGLKWT
ncbi:uncharacterized protein LOC113291860 [Papaver somniferum]|uniref:uncharacterized protein LOC113291860 n=1 Tax=Papaver somniferum TaxID=3469 RepID=UPI000E704D08|nr:uncharacterized protein LOC113291860 [Papaver somniferum]